MADLSHRRSPPLCRVAGLLSSASSGSGRRPIILPPALRHRDFRLFGTGLAFSAGGSEFTLVAMAWQLYELTDSPLQVGLLGLARAIPQLSMLPFGGVLADAVDRRRLLMATQCAQFVVSALLVALTVSGGVTPLLLYLANGALALCAALDNPTRRSIVPSLVPRRDLTSALALTNMLQKLGLIIGPGLAGVVLAVSGPALCYAVDALSWLAMLVALLPIRSVGRSAASAGAISLRSIGEGVSFVRTNPVIIWMMVLDFGATFFGTNRALLPVYARDILQVGASGLGLMFAAPSVGGVLAGGVLSVLPPMRHMGRWVLLGVGFYAVCTAAFALSRDFGFSLLLLAGVGAGNALSAVLRGAIMQLSTPDRLLGRVASVNAVATNGGPQLGQVQSGLLAELAGAPAAVLLGGLATLGLSGLLAAVPVVRNFQPPPIRPRATPAPESG